MRPILVYDGHPASSGGTQSVYAIPNATIDPIYRIGSPFGFFEYPVSSAVTNNNSVIKIGRYIYLWTGEQSTTTNKIYRYDTLSPTNDWELYQTLGTHVNSDVGRSSKTGLFSVLSNTTRYLCGVRQGTTASNIVGFRINLDTDVLEESSSNTLTGSNNTSFVNRAAILYKNSIFFLTGSTTLNLRSYNPISNVITSYTSSLGILGSDNRFRFIVYNEKLYLMARRSSGTTTNLEIWEYDNVTNIFQHVLNTSININMSPVENSHWSFCVAPGSISGYSIWGLVNHYDGGAQFGWKLIEIYESPTSIFETIDWTNNLPNPFILGNGGANSTGKWEFLTDNETNPSNPTYELIYRTSSNTGSVLSRYNFSTNPVGLTFIDNSYLNGGLIQIPADRTGLGSRTWADGEPYIEVVADESLTNGDRRLSFYVYSTGSVEVEFYYGIRGETVLFRASLANPSSGSINSNTDGDYISGLTANGSTLYEVDWLAATVDNVNDAQYYQIMGRVINV